MFHKVVRQHMQGVVEFLTTSLLQIYQGTSQWKNENLLRFNEIMAMSLWPHCLAHPVCFEKSCYAQEKRNFVGLL